jgi:glycosylphosphatidylinositol transamidase
MVNFPQALLLAGLTMIHLSPAAKVRGLAGAGLMIFGWYVHFGSEGGGVDFREEWREFGNVFWPGVFGVWVPLYGIGLMI